MNPLWEIPLRDRAANGYTWYAREPDGSLYFMKQNPNGTYMDMRCLPEDMTNGNFEYFAKHGLTNTNKAPK